MLQPTTCNRHWVGDMPDIAYVTRCDDCFFSLLDTRDDISYGCSPGLTGIQYDTYAMILTTVQVLELLEKGSTTRSDEKWL